MKLLPFQVEGVQWLHGRTHGLLADEQGLGKTVQAACILEPGSVVVCPTTLGQNWVSEIRQWRPDLDPQLVRTGRTQILPGTDVLVVPYSLLSWHSLEDVYPSTLVVDEAHYVKNASKKRSLGVSYLAARSNHVYLLTGTPIPNRTRELWAPLRLVRGTELQYDEFTDKFSAPEFRKVPVKRRDRTGREYVKITTVRDDSGASNIPELRQLLNGCMLRRTKAQVLQELPPMRHQIIRVHDGKLDPDEDDVCTTIDRAAMQGVLPQQVVPFADMSRFRRECGRRKLPAAKQYLADWLDENEGQKLVVFAHHIEVVSELAEALYDYGIVCITGDTPTGDRDGLVKQFQSNERVRVFIGNIQAAGVGLTLTAASNVVFVEQDWVPGVMAQAADRIHRIGQHDACLAQYLVTNGMDGHLMSVIAEKLKVINGVLA